MSSSQQIVPSLTELDQIRNEIARARSVEELRPYFDRLKVFRLAYSEDFDGLLAVTDTQELLFQRARELRSGNHPFEAPPAPLQPTPLRTSSDAAEIPPEMERLDAKNWQRAIYIGLFFALILFAAFFYLIQTARRLNLDPAPATASTAAVPAKNTVAQPVVQTAPDKPAVRLYTDLIPGSVTVDDNAAQDLKDGEMTFTALTPGQHKITVTGRTGTAQFSYDVNDQGAPTIASEPTATNAMAVLVETHDGQARLLTNVRDSDVSLDGNPAGQSSETGLSLNNLGKEDHLLLVTEGKDRQRFVLTHTDAPTLTVYVKSDPNAGTVVLVTKVDGAEVYINDNLYRRQTQSGQLRIPLNAGQYTIRVHKTGFIDPPPATVQVKKAEETAVNIPMELTPQIATLQIKGALPGTMVYVDRDYAATANADGFAAVPNVKPGVHNIDLRRDQALPKQFQRTFKTGDSVVLSGPDVMLERAVVDSSTPAPPPSKAATANSAPNATQNYSMEMDGQQVRKGGGFVAYHVPHVSGHYSFAGQARLGGILKHGKLQWYAGYQDPENYVLFSVDGKHATVHEVQNGKTTEINRIPFDADSNTWVQVDLAIHPNSVSARIKSPDGTWSDLGTVPSSGRDFTQGRVGFYIPEKDEIAIANFRFAAQ